MSYSIESEKLTVFLENNRIKLPRFQRKSTWDEKQKFELCISVFQDYPVGVVILNEMQHTSWLLDGRQRREALITMRDNPVELYKWARTYIGFKQRDDELEISNAYWSKIDRFLQAEQTTKKQENSSDADEVNFYSDEEDPNEVLDYSSEMKSFDSLLQRKGLETLLNLILMVHQIKPSGSRWEKLFDFKSYVQKLRYAPKKLNEKIDPVLLRQFLLGLISEIKKEYDGNLTCENFIEIYKENFTITNEDGFEKTVRTNWSQIKESLDIIDASENIFTSARIGIIRLSNASPLDAQNIFSRINSGGTQLKAEELLSAKPYWNKTLANPSSALREIVKELYSRLDIPTPDNVCRWDVAATLISRISDQGLIFDSYEQSRIKKEVSIEEITLGFKLISSIIIGGMSNKHVVELEKEGEIDWEDTIDEIIRDIDGVCKLLLDSSFFKFLQSWRKPITKLLGNAIALEFISILLIDWKEKGRPTGGGNYKAVQRDAKILFDRLIFEYATRAWKGSGDSKMARDIKNWKERIIGVEESSWKIFIEEACTGRYNGQSTSKELYPVLYYYYVLKEMSPTIDANTKFEVDHIYPQEKFNGNNMVDQNLKDSLINFALLPKKENISKGSRALNEIPDAWLKEQIARFTNIPQSEFERFSNIANIGELQDIRRSSFLEAFSNERDKQLQN